MLKIIKNLMNRKSLLSLGRFKVRIHKFSNKDKSGKLHNHPFSYISIVLSGGYTEELKDGVITHQPTGAVIIRKSNTPHRIISCLENTKTLIITFYNKTNEWNFCESVYKETDKEILNKLAMYRNGQVYTRILSDKALFCKFDNGVWFKGHSNYKMASLETQPSMDQETPSIIA